MILRRYTPDDAGPCHALFRRSILEGAQADYDTAQRTAWAGPVDPGDGWAERLADGHTVIAEEEGEVAGFMTLRSDGYLDFAYVDPAHQGSGLVNRLYAAILRAARDRNLSRLSTDASHPARRFFARNGWRHERTQTVTRNGVALTNHRMTLDLTS